MGLSCDQDSLVGLQPRGFAELGVTPFAGLVLLRAGPENGVTS